jgi:hypothetical protein
MWNVKRPYMRCLCNPRAINGYKGSIIWFDHAIWNMINKLEVFFLSYPTPIARFAAFMIWMRELAKMAVKAAIVFQTSREHMIRAAIQLSENPHQCLLTDIADTPIASKIERLLKGPKFSLAHSGFPSLASSPYIKQRLNLNATPSDRTFSSGRGRNSPSGRGGSPNRGGRTIRGRGGGRASWRNPNPGNGSLLTYSGFAGVGSADSPASPNNAPTNPGPGVADVADTRTSVQLQQANNFYPLKESVILWDDKI